MPYRVGVAAAEASPRVVRPRWRPLGTLGAIVAVVIIAAGAVAFRMSLSQYQPLALVEFADCCGSRTTNPSGVEVAVGPYSDGFYLSFELENNGGRPIHVDWVRIAGEAGLSGEVRNLQVSFPNPQGPEWPNPGTIPFHSFDLGSRRGRGLQVTADVSNCPARSWGVVSLGGLVSFNSLLVRWSVYSVTHTTRLVLPGGYFTFTPSAQCPGPTQ